MRTIDEFNGNEVMSALAAERTPKRTGPNANLLLKTTYKNRGTARDALEQAKLDQLGELADIAAERYNDYLARASREITETEYSLRSDILDLREELANNRYAEVFETAFTLEGQTR